jgi:hypothetical protein
VAQGSRACENAEEVPRRLDWGEGQRGIEELLGRLIVDGKFVVCVWPPADRVHRLAAEGRGRCLPSHHSQGRCGGKNHVAASPQHVNTRVQRHGHDVKDGMGFGEGGSEPCQSVVIIPAVRFSEHSSEHRLIEERDAQQDGARASGGREHFGLGMWI